MDVAEVAESVNPIAARPWTAGRYGTTGFDIAANFRDEGADEFGVIREPTWRRRNNLALTVSDAEIRKEAC